MSSQRVHSNNTVAVKSVGVDTVRTLGFLEDAQVQVVLGHPYQLKLDSSVSAVADILQYKRNHHLGSSPSLAPFPLPRSRPLTNAHSLPTTKNYLPLPSKFMLPRASGPSTLMPPLSCYARAGLSRSRSCSCIPLPLLCYSLQYGVMRIALIPGQVSP